MRDSSHHGGRPADPNTPGELAVRLLHRAKGGVGVIDSGWTQKHFAYTTDWIAERFAMLGLLNTRFGTIDNQTAGTSTALPVVHGSFARKQFGTSHDEASTHAANNESSTHTPLNEAPTRMQTNEASTPKTGNEGSALKADDRTQTSRREPRAAEIPAPSQKIGETPIVPVIQRKSAMSFPDAALSRAESQRTAPQKSQPTTAPKSQPPSVRESAPQSVIEHPSPDEPPDAMTVEGRVSQPSVSDATPDSTNTKQGVEVLETVVRPHATHEHTLHIDTRVESTSTVEEAGDDAIMLGGSIEPNPMPPSTDEQRAQTSRTASPLPLRESAPVVSRVMREASSPLVMRSETFEPGVSESESPLSGATDPQGEQSETNSSLPVAKEQTATEHHTQDGQRTLHALAASPTTAEVMPHTTQAGDVRTHPHVSAPEVLQRPLHLYGARMIWRKGFGATHLAVDDVRHAGQPGVTRTHSVQNVSSWPTLYRAEAAANDAHSASGDGVSFAPAAHAQSEAGGIDLEQITEHVSRVILRRVSVERERRGIGRWL